MKILITGGNGFLGSHLTRYFLKKGFKIGLILRESSRLDRVSDLMSEVEVGIGTSSTQISSFIEKFNPDVIVHTACSYGRHGETWSDLVEVNSLFGFRILDSIKYSSKDVSFINVGTALGKNASLYGLSKHMFSDYAKDLVKLVDNSHLKFINISLQHMYGVDDHDSKFPSYVINQCLSDTKYLDLTIGEQQRDFIYIDDVTSAFYVLISRLQDIESGENIDIGSGLAPTIREFVEMVKEVTKASTTLNFGALPYRDNESMLCQADIRKITNLGWRAEFTIRQGILEIIQKGIKL